MPSFNQVLLMGNVTRDPQIKALPNGSQVADFGIAVKRKYRTAGGEDKEETCFVDCAAFGKQAEVIGQYCTKGKPLFIEGRLKYDTWEDKAGGKRSTAAKACMRPRWPAISTTARPRGDSSTVAGAACSSRMST